MILITGATGFIGSTIMTSAIARGEQVRVFVRRADDPVLSRLPANSIAVGDLESPETMTPAVDGVDTVVHCAAATSVLANSPDAARRINVEGTKLLLDAAITAGVRRWIQISTMSAHAGSTSVYGKTKFEADEIIRASSIGWTILRPSLVFGNAERGLVSKTLTMIRKLPVIPIIGSGRDLLRPIHVDDLVGGIFQCIEEEATIGKTYMIGSGSEVSLDEFFRAIASAGGMKKPLVHIPIPIAMVLARILGVISKNPPITLDNVLGIRELQRVEIEPAQRDFGFSPGSFEEGLERAFGRQST